MKLTTRLLLGATVVAGLSISAFAACASDVDFGGTKKITGLADGTQTGEAVHYGQLMDVASSYTTMQLVCNNTIQTITEFNTGPFQVHAHHFSLSGHNYAGSVTAYSTLGLSGHFSLASDLNSTLPVNNLRILNSPGSGALQYRCGSSNIKIRYHAF